MTVDSLRKKGLSVLRGLVGDKYIEKRIESTNEFNRNLRELSELCMGSVWTRTELDLATRSLVTVSMLIALGRSHELSIHIDAALTNGSTPAQLKEVILHAVIYCGFPAAGDAGRIAEEVFRQRGIPLQKTSHSGDM
jgi:4-carboxymuconolactone decarboxylase